MTGKIDAAIATQWRNIEAQSGRTRDQWIKLAAASGKPKHGELVAWLKSQHGLGHGNANLIARSALDAASGSPQREAGDLVDALFTGKKAALRPLYDALMVEVRRLGPDVELAPKKTYVSLRRNKQFALVQPSTADRLDLGLNLKGVAPSGRLEPSGSFNAMCTHRIRLGDEHGGIDAATRRWLAQAYAGA